MIAQPTRHPKTIDPHQIDGQDNTPIRDDSMPVDCSDVPQPDSPVRGACADTPPVCVSTVLKNARLAKSLEREDVADILRINYAYVAALEDGLSSRLPERVYTLGYVRSYARLVGLEPDEMVTRFESAFFKETPGGSSPYTFPEWDGKGDRKNRLWLLISGFLLLSLVGAWFVYDAYRFDSSVTVSLKTVTAPQERQNLSFLDHVANFLSVHPLKVSKKESHKPMAFPPEKTPLKDKAPPSKRRRLPALAYQDGAARLPQEKLNDPALTQTTAANATGVVPPMGTAKIKTPTSPIFTGDPTAPSIQLAVVEPCWVEVKDDAQKVLLSGTLNPGETYDVPKRSGLRLSVGNAGGVLMRLGGDQPQPLGKPGEVKHNIPLTVQSLSDELKKSP